jgi:hypothetical protein
MGLTNVDSDLLPGTLELLVLRLWSRSRATATPSSNTCGSRPVTH